VAQLAAIKEFIKKIQLLDYCWGEYPMKKKKSSKICLQLIGKPQLYIRA